MARTALTRVASPTPYATAGVDVTPLVAIDAVNGNSIQSTGSEALLVYNSDSSSHTVTVTSANDPYGRTGSIVAQAIPAGKTFLFGPFPTLGWQQSDGTLWLDGNSALLKVTAITGLESGGA